MFCAYDLLYTYEIYTYMYIPDRTTIVTDNEELWMELGEVPLEQKRKEKETSEGGRGTIGTETKRKGNKWSWERYHWIRDEKKRKQVELGEVPLEQRRKEKETSGGGRGTIGTETKRKGSKWSWERYHSNRN
jgi:hypothetical protein